MSKTLQALTILAVLAMTPPASPQVLPQSNTDVMVVRYACLVGGREAAADATSAGVLSRKELVDFLLEWEPEADNDEMRQTFALNNLSEVMRQASQLPLGGGELASTFTLGGSEYQIGMRITPVRRGTWMGDPGSPFSFDVGSELRILADIRYAGEPLVGPTKILYTFGERAIITYTSGPGAPFLFLVVEVDRVTADQLANRGLRHAWRKGIRLVDGDEVTAPVAIEKTAPSYTEEGRKAKHQGRVVLRTVIDEHGLVEDVEVIEGQPYGLSDAAMAAVRTWRFHPALFEGEPVAVIYVLTINFRLE